MYTITVTNNSTSSSDEGSLAWAIQQAQRYSYSVNDDIEIVFQEGLAGETFSADGLISIMSSLRLRGTKSAPVTINDSLLLYCFSSPSSFKATDIIFAKQISINSCDTINFENCTFLRQDVFNLSYWSGDTTFLSEGLINCTYKGTEPYIYIGSFGGDTRLAKLPNEISGGYHIQVYTDISGIDLTLADGVIISPDSEYFNMTFNAPVHCEGTAIFRKFASAKMDMSGNNAYLYPGSELHFSGPVTGECLEVYGTLYLDNASACQVSTLILHDRYAAVVKAQYNATGKSLLPGSSIITTDAQATLLFDISCGDTRRMDSDILNASIKSPGVNTSIFALRLDAGDILRIKAGDELKVNDVYLNGGTLILEEGATLKGVEEACNIHAEGSTISSSGGCIEGKLFVNEDTRFEGTALKLLGEAPLVLNEWSGDTASIKSTGIFDICSEINTIKLSDPKGVCVLSNLGKGLNQYALYSISYTDECDLTLEKGVRLIIDDENSPYLFLERLTMEEGSSIGVPQDRDGSSVYFSVTSYLQGNNASIDAILALSPGCVVEGSHIELSSEYALSYSISSLEEAVQFIRNSPFICTHKNAIVAYSLPHDGENITLNNDIIEQLKPQGCQKVTFDCYAGQNSNVTVEENTELTIDGAFIYGDDSHLIFRSGVNVRGTDEYAYISVANSTIEAENTVFGVTLDIGPGCILSGNNWHFAAGGTALRANVDWADIQQGTPLTIIDGVSYDVLNKDAAFGANINLFQDEDEVLISDELLQRITPDGFKETVLSNVESNGVNINMLRLEDIKLSGGLSCYYQQPNVHISNCSFIGDDMMSFTFNGSESISITHSDIGSSRVSFIYCDEVNIRDCSGIGTLSFVCDNQMKVVLSGNDLSNADIDLSNFTGTIDLSGNFWGTTDREAILSRFGSDRNKVILNSIRPALDMDKFFTLAEGSETGLYAERKARTITLSFTHNIDARTATPHTISLFSETGERIGISSISVSGRQLSLTTEQPLADGAYKIHINAGLRNIEGEAANVPEVPLWVAQQQTSVLLLQEGNTGVGQFDHLDLYLRDTVSPERLRAAAHLVDMEKGGEVVITSVTGMQQNGHEFYRLQFAPVNTKGNYELRVDGKKPLNDAGLFLQETYRHLTHVTSPDLTVRTTTDSTSPHTFRNQQEAVLTYTVANIGDEMISSWVDTIYISDSSEWDALKATPFTRVYHTNEALGAGETYTETVSLQDLSLELDKAKYLFVRTDSTNHISETNEENNISYLGAYIRRADVLTTGQEQLITAKAGETLYWVWTAEQDGLVNITSPTADIRVSDSGWDELWKKAYPTNRSASGTVQTTSFEAHAGQTYYIAETSTANTSAEGHQLAYAPASISTVGSTNFHYGLNELSLSGINVDRLSDFALSISNGITIPFEIKEQTTTGILLSIDIPSTALMQNLLDAVVTYRDECGELVHNPLLQANLSYGTSFFRSTPILKEGVNRINFSTSNHKSIQSYVLRIGDMEFNFKQNAAQYVKDDMFALELNLTVEQLSNFTKGELVEASLSGYDRTGALVEYARADAYIGEPELSLSFLESHYNFFIRDGSVLDLKVSCRNTGDVEAAAPLVLIRESGTQSQLYYKRVSTYEAASKPARKALLYYSGNESAKPDILGKGETQIYTFYERSLESTEATLTYLLKADNTRYVKDEEWELLESALRPEQATDEEWAAWWQEMRARMGRRVCDIVSFVSAMHKELSAAENKAAQTLPDIVQCIMADHADFKPSFRLSGQITLSQSGKAYADKMLYLLTRQGEEWVEVDSVRTDNEGHYCFYGLSSDADYAISAESTWFNGSYREEGESYLTLPVIGDDATMDGIVTESLTDESTVQHTHFSYLSDDAGNEYRFYLQNGILTIAKRENGGWGAAIELSTSQVADYEAAWDAATDSFLCVWMDKESGTFYHRAVQLGNGVPGLSDINTLSDLRTLVSLQQNTGGGFNVIGGDEGYRVGDAYTVYSVKYKASDFTPTSSLALTLPDTAAYTQSDHYHVSREFDLGIFQFSLGGEVSWEYDNDCSITYQAGFNSEFVRDTGGYRIDVKPNAIIGYNITRKNNQIDTGWTVNGNAEFSYLNKTALISVLKYILIPFPAYAKAADMLGAMIRRFNKESTTMELCAGLGVTLDLEKIYASSSGESYCQGNLTLDSVLSFEYNEAGKNNKDKQQEDMLKAGSSLSVKLGGSFKSPTFDLRDFIKSSTPYFSIDLELEGRLFGFAVRYYLSYSSQKEGKGVDQGIELKWLSSDSHKTSGYISTNETNLDSTTCLTVGNEVLTFATYSDAGESMLAYTVNDSATGQIIHPETAINFAALEGSAGVSMPEHYTLSLSDGAVGADGNSAVYTICFSSAIDGNSLPLTMTVEQYDEWIQEVSQEQQMLSFRYRDSRLTLLNTSAIQPYVNGLQSKAQLAYEGKDYLAWICLSESGLYELYVSSCAGDMWSRPVCILQSEKRIAHCSLTVSTEGLLCGFTAEMPIGDSEWTDTFTFQSKLGQTGWEQAVNAWDGTPFISEKEMQRFVERHEAELRENNTGSIGSSISAWWDRKVQSLLKIITPDFPNCKDNNEAPPEMLAKQTKKSWDPNDIAGPEGVGEENYVTPGHYTYLIRCENDADKAVASAARVLITQQLDKNLDWSTFRLGNINIAGIYVEMPEDVSNYQNVLDWTDTLGVLVEVKAGIDYKTGIATWSLIALDPETHDIPADAFVGLLAPNVNAPEGEAWVQYSIDAKENAAHDSIINAQATIIFDWNEPIDTPAIHCRLDKIAPEAAMRTTVQRLDAVRYAIAWDGNDVGSGIDSVDIYLSRDGGGWNLWASGLHEQQAVFTAEDGLHHYVFCAVAHDRSGNVQSTPGEYLQLNTDSGDYTHKESLISGFTPLYRDGQFYGLSIRGDEAQQQTFRSADFTAILRIVNQQTGEVLQLKAEDFLYDAQQGCVTWAPKSLPAEAVYTIAVRHDTVPESSVQLQSAGVLAHVSAYAAPVLIDLNQDGAPDLVVGENADGTEGRIRIYLNNGTAAEPLYTTFTYAQTQQDVIHLPAEACLGAAPSFTDINGDGLADMVIGQANGKLSVYIRREEGNVITWENHGYLSSKDGAHTSAIDAGDRAMPLFCDWNGDGLTDLLLGNMDGTLTVHLNNGSIASPSFAPGYLVYDGATPLKVSGGRSSFVVADFDGDGIRDLISGNSDGSLYFYHNYGTAEHALFSGSIRITDIEGNTRLGGGGRSRLFAEDINGDGCYDLLVGGSDGNVQSYLCFPFHELGAFSARELDKPGAVSDLQVKVEGKRMVVTWAEVEGMAIHYEIRLKSASGSHSVFLADTVFTTHVEDGEYTVEIRAIDSDVVGEWSAPLPVLVDTVPPASPSALLAVAERNTVQLSWCSVSDAARYEVRYKAAHSGVWQHVSASGTALTLSGMDADTFAWQVRAVDAADNASDWVDGCEFATSASSTDTMHYWATDLLFSNGGTLIDGYEDVNKSGLSDSKLCWAAAASNALAWWQRTGVTSTQRADAPSTAEDIYATFTENWANASGQDAYGFIWWLSGESDSESYTAYSDLHLKGEDGGYYKNFYTAETLAETVSQSSLQHRSPADLREQWAQVYAEGGMLTLGVFREADGQLTDGHSLTLWGFSTDVATGIIKELHVTDSDDNAHGITSLQVLYDEALGYYRIAGGTPKLQGYLLGTATSLRAFNGSLQLILHEPQVIKNGDGTVTVTFTWECDTAASYRLSIGDKDYMFENTQQHTLVLPESARDYVLLATAEDGAETRLSGHLSYDESAAHGMLIRFRGQTFGNFCLYTTAGDTIGGGDAQDYYRFTATEDGTYAIGTDITTPGGSFLLSLGTVDAAGDYVVQRSLTTGKGSTNAIEGLNLRKGETAYIRISSEAAAETAYELRVAGEVPAAASLTDNNTAATADALVGSSKPAAVQGWVGYGDACDFYRLQLAETSSLQLTLSGVDTAARVKVYAEQANGARALISTGTATAVAGLDRTLALTAGSYFIEVAALNPDSGLGNSAYTMELKEQKGKQNTHYMLATR